MTTPPAEREGAPPRPLPLRLFDYGLYVIALTGARTATLAWVCSIAYGQPQAIVVTPVIGAIWIFAWTTKPRYRARS